MFFKLQTVYILYLANRSEEAFENRRGSKMLNHYLSFTVYYSTSCSTTQDFYGTLYYKASTLLSIFILK